MPKFDRPAHLPCLSSLRKQGPTPQPLMRRPGGSRLSPGRRFLRALIKELLVQDFWHSPDEYMKGHAMPDYRFSTVTDEGRLLIVTLNRPEVMNALHNEAHWELDGVWNEV